MALRSGVVDRRRLEPGDRSLGTEVGRGDGEPVAVRGTKPPSRLAGAAPARRSPAGVRTSAGSEPSFRTAATTPMAAATRAIAASEATTVRAGRVGRGAAVSSPNGWRADLGLAFGGCRRLHRRPPGRHSDEDDIDLVPPAVKRRGANRREERWSSRQTLPSRACPSRRCASSTRSRTRSSSTPPRPPRCSHRTAGLEAATVSACPDCHSRVLAAVALIDLVDASAPHPRCARHRRVGRRSPDPAPLRRRRSGRLRASVVARPALRRVARGRRRRGRASRPLTVSRRLSSTSLRTRLARAVKGRRDVGSPLYFMHIMKTGGTALTTALARLCDDVHAGESVTEVFLDQFVLRDPQRWNEVGFVTGHLPWEVRELLPPATRSLTVFRDPVDRTLLALLAAEHQPRRAGRVARLLARGVRRVAAVEHAVPRLPGPSARAPRRSRARRKTLRAGRSVREPRPAVPIGAPVPAAEPLRLLTADPRPEPTLERAALESLAEIEFVGVTEHLDVLVPRGRRTGLVAARPSAAGPGERRTRPAAPRVGVGRPRAPDRGDDGRRPRALRGGTASITGVRVDPDGRVDTRRDGVQHCSLSVTWGRVA